jgi:adenylate kinase
MRIVLLGAPGSGKKTQTSLLADKYRLTVVTSGELVKQASAEECERGLQQQAGQPLSDDVVLSMLQERIDRGDLSSGFILDGFPRNLLQALTLDEMLDEMGLSLDFVLLFEIQTDALMERLVGRRTCRSCGAVYNVYTQPTVVEDICDLCGGRLHQRADDTEEAVSSRLHVFDHLTAPLLSHYGKQGKVVRVDGEGEVKTVFTRTCQAIDGFLTQRSAEKARVELPAVRGGSEAAAASRSANNTAGAKSAVAKKASGKKIVTKKTATGKKIVKKTASRPGMKNKPTSKPTTTQQTIKRKTVKKQATKMHAKGSSGRR